MSQAVLTDPHSILARQLIVESRTARFISKRAPCQCGFTVSFSGEPLALSPNSVVWKKLPAQVMANVLGQHYFTDIYRNGKPVKYLNFPTEYHLSRRDNQAVLEFVLPLAEPQPLVGKPFEISTYDPSNFVDMTYKGPTALHLPLAKLSLITPKPDISLRVYALSLDKNDSPGEDRALGQQFVQRVTLQCQ
ncbi:MAG: DUF1007 family protein [Serratia symbiotica]|nr:DUF1007 family protein [Serratia symbiotica]